MNKSTFFYTGATVVFGCIVAFGLTHGASVTRSLLSSRPVSVLNNVTERTSEDKIFTETEKTIEKEPIEIVAPKNDPKTTAGKHIIADLKEMDLSLYEDGAFKATFPIISKGRKGTAWETIPGDYKIGTREQNHFSSIGHVWMPYSIQFFGNYFIHGWPYYESGAPVSSGYSGGCIRLSTADAKKVFAFADTNTAVHVVGDQEIVSEGSGSYKILNSKKAPFVSASSYIVADLDTGDVILKKNENDLHPMASLAKLMTATVDLETLNQYQNTTITKKVVDTYGSQGELKRGEVISIKDLLYPLLLESSNDAAEALASHLGRDRFIKLMNDKAEAIALSNTHFDDPAGLSPETRSTAHDLFKLVQYIYKYKQFVLDVTRRPQYTAHGHEWHNGSPFISDPNYIGGKNGYTDEADHTLISLFSLPLSEFSTRHIAVVLLSGGRETKEKDMRAMVSFVSHNIVYNPEDVAFK